jgi:hypothetical protein
MERLIIRQPAARHRSRQWSQKRRITVKTTAGSESLSSLTFLGNNPAARRYADSRRSHRANRFESTQHLVPLIKVLFPQPGSSPKNARDTVGDFALTLFI